MHILRQKAPRVSVQRTVKVVQNAAAKIILPWYAEGPIQFHANTTAQQ